ncbi:hypothetical protein GQ457_18G003150 [Hibiscus cannabinus]
MEAVREELEQLRKENEALRSMFEVMSSKYRMLREAYLRESNSQFPTVCRGLTRFERPDVQLAAASCSPIDFDFFRDFWMSFNTYRRLSTMGGWGKQSWWSDGGYEG